jgi:predicted transglutaminase-like cysteine proteinase
MDFKAAARLGLVATIVAAGASAAAASGPRLSPFMRVTGNAGDPIAACLLDAEDCDPAVRHTDRVALSPDKWADLVAVNNSVNAEGQPGADPDVADGLASSLCPVDHENCAERVLRKRSLLLRAGWPAETLLVTIVRQRNGDDHTVLTVVTDRGDLVLDNREAHILVWSETEYRYTRRQSPLGAGVWLAINDGLQSPDREN